MLFKVHSGGGPLVSMLTSIAIFAIQYTDDFDMTSNVIFHILLIKYI